MKKRLMLLVLLCAVLVLACDCKQNPTEEQLFAKLIAHFEERGYSCELSKLEDESREVPIYKASVWHRLLVNGEEVLVYFDESNRADYLADPIDESVYGHVSRFGLRFVVIYPGQDAGIVKALEEMPK